MRHFERLLNLAKYLSSVPGFVASIEVLYKDYISTLNEVTLNLIFLVFSDIPFHPYYIRI